MGLIMTIAEKAAVSVVTAIFPPAGWLLKALGLAENLLIWWFGNLVRCLVTIIFVLLVLSLDLVGIIESKNEKIAEQKSNLIEQQERSRQLAEQALLHQNAVSEANAEMSRLAHQKELTDAKSALDHYISNHRLSAYNKLRPSNDKSEAGQPAATPNSDGSSLAAGVSADYVVVSTGNLQKCDTAITYAIDAHNWALTVNQVK